MPRSFRFEHFTMGAPRAPTRPGRERVVRPLRHRRPERLRYGRQHQETVERFHMDRLDHHPVLPAPPRPRTEAQPFRPGAVPAVPIGALPAPTLAPVTPESLNDLLSDAERRWTALARAAADFWRAGRWLAALPWEATKLLTRRSLGPLHRVT
jgi:hypothetical protein